MLSDNISTLVKNPILLTIQLFPLGPQIAPELTINILMQHFLNPQPYLQHRINPQHPCAEYKPIHQSIQIPLAHKLAQCLIETSADVVEKCIYVHIQMLMDIVCPRAEGRSGLFSLDTKVVLKEFYVAQDLFNKGLLFLGLGLVGGTGASQGHVFLDIIAYLGAIQEIESNERKIKQIFL